MDNSVRTILEYARELTKQNVVGRGDCISVRAGEYMYVSAADVSLSALQEADVLRFALAEAPQGEYALHARIYAAKEEAGAICHCHPAWVAPIAQIGGKIPAVADDMTQIVGLDCKTCADNEKAIVKQLKKRNSTLVGDGCITTGRTLNEAYTCVLVLDKAAHCYVGAAALRKNVLINAFEAKLMNVIYKMKYSKQNQKALQSEEGN